MKKIIYNRIYFLQFFCFVAVFALLFGCEKDEVNPPVISEIRNYDASPNDTIISSLNTGQWVVLLGKNLSDVRQVYFGSIPATINGTLLTNESIVVQVPNIPFESVPRDKVNIITAVNSSGMASFEINITGAPLITHVRNYAPAPNDTIVNAVVPGQQINIIGFNINNATKIAFQGVEANLREVVYTDSSVIVKLPTDFSKANPALANKITYSTKIDSSTYSIIIYDPEILKFYSDPMYTSLTGGIGKAKTWRLDLDADAKSTKFIGPIWWAGLDVGWNKQCGAGGSCWTYEVDYQSWFPAAKDYGTMTFQLKGNVVVQPVLTVTQKGVDAAKNGTFTGSFFMDVNAKTITFIDVVPLNFGWQYVFTKAYIISLTEDGMQLGFRDPVKSEYAVHNYVKK
jgi:hypothetical protein